jgi:glycosyltransferase involved in cell wall biosynthesis/O-antigen/teichoic acid export membrane protein
VAGRLKLTAPKILAPYWSRLTTGILGRGAVSLLIATAGVNISNFLFHIVISRLLGPAHYGAVGSILSILSLLAIPLGAAQLAVTQAVIGHVDNNESYSLSKLIWRSLFVGILAMLVFDGLIPTIDGFLHLSSPLPLFLVSTWIPLATVGAVLRGALIGEYRYRAIAFSTFFGGGPIRLLFGAALVEAGFGVSGAIVATIIAQAFSTGSLLFSARQKVRSHPKATAVRTAGRDMTLSVASIGSFTALIGVDTLLARHFFPATEAGLYAAGAVAAHIALFLPGSIVTVAFPHWVSGEGTSASSRKAFKESLKYTFLISIVTAGVLAVFSSLVVHALFGSKYAHASSIIGLLSLASALIGIINLFVYFHLARRSLFALTPWLGVALAIILISLRHQNMTSVALMMLIVSSLTLLATAIPAILALAAAHARDAAGDASLIELPPAELEFTLVVPFYNPGSQLGRHIGEVINVLSLSGISYEILAVSDGSTDRSEEQLSTIFSDHLTLVRLQENQGKGAALRAGLSLGRGEYLGFIDGDGDLPASLLANVLRIIKREQPDIIFGSKRHPRSEVEYPPLRRFYSWSYQQLNRTLFHMPVRDTQTGVKVIRRDVLVAVLPRMVEKRFAFDLELFVVARQQGFRNFVEMPVTIGERFSSTISFRSVRKMLLDTLAIFYRLRVLRFYERDIRGKNEETLLTLTTKSPHTSDLEITSPNPTENGDPRLRILILNWRDITHPLAGGAEVYTHNIAMELVKLGHSVTLFCAAVEGRPTGEIIDGVHIVRRGSRHGVYGEARRFYRNDGLGNFDLVVDEVNTRPFGTPRWVRDTPVIALIHQVCREIWFYQTPLPIAIIGRYVLEPYWLHRYRDTLTVTVSESSKISLEDYGLSRIKVVPEGLRAIENPPEVQREVRPTIAFVGRLSASKRPEEAIEAFLLVRETMPTAQLWMIGTGPMEDRLRMSAPDGVQFLGKISPDEKIQRLARAHVLIATSVREGWGLVVSEAAAVGTPTVAYDVAGLRDSVLASQGFLSAPTPKDLSSEIQRFFDHWSSKGLPQVSAEGVVSWSQVAKSILSVAVEGSPALQRLRVPQH